MECIELYWKYYGGIMNKLLGFLLVFLQSCTINLILTNTNAEGSSDTVDEETRATQEVSPDISLPIKPF